MWIVFEGVDGSGKTTLINKVAEMMIAEGFDDVLVTREPGSPHVKFCERLRSILFDKTLVCSPYAALVLFMIDRSEHFRQVIQPNQSKVILQDRNYISTEIYQMKIEMDNRIPEDLMEFHKSVSEIPDGYVFIDLPFELAMQRRKQKAEEVEVLGESLYDSKPDSYHLYLHQLYRATMNSDLQTRKIVLNGSFPVKMMADKCIAFIKSIRDVRLR